MLVVEAVGNDLIPTYSYLMRTLLEHGLNVDTGHWQATKDVPMTRTRELQNVVFTMPIRATPGSLASYVRPNLPWAEDHFAERVSGIPTNPGEQYKNWPWYKGNVEAHKETGQFSHTYQERLWPRHAGDDDRFLAYRSGGGVIGRKGIRYRYGDLDDVADLLAREPHTRQAYVPIWFPEDTGAHHQERVPCTLGYHFMLRQGVLNCTYNIRSCDLVRYFRDDAYMASRLTQWFIGRAQELRQAAWDDVLPGTLMMVIPSLHVFEAELPSLRSKYGT